MQNIIKCAVYTRKSTDEGLEKDYNTLEAQRDAGLNYIKSQVYQGWEAVPDHYDDGGYSGGNMKRPALQRLLEDVCAGKVNMIVVYKIDRLTRSLVDFAKLIEILDKHHCSFVSVTQQFNTADSTGRLMLNVLLSFAQFEREISAERIRDKFSASKKKGMWMGGVVPLGYDVDNRKLVINPKEAKVVKFIFDTYLAQRSELKTCRLVNEAGYITKSWICKTGKECGGKKFTHNTLSSLLRNPIYAGKINNHGELYDGQHEAIIPYEIWKKVQHIKKTNVRNRFGQASMKHSLLKGFIECGLCGHAMTPASSKKGGKYYDYYKCSTAIKEGHEICPCKIVSAGELDTFVINQVKLLFRSPEIIQEIIKQVQAKDPKFSEQEIIMKVKSIDEMFQYFEPATLAELIKFVVSKVIINPNSIVIRYNDFGYSLINNLIKNQNTVNEKRKEITYPVEFKSKHGRVLIITPDNTYKEKGEIDLEMLNALCRAFHWKELLDKRGITITSLAHQEKMDRSYMCRVLLLTTLAPDIIESIFNGTQPRELCLRNILRSKIPALWDAQRSLFGFPPVIRV